MRLQKFIAHAGVCSRRKAEEYIIKGFIKVNGLVVKELGTKIDPDTDKVLFKNQSINIESNKSKTYIILNKPAGYVTTCSQDSTKIILDLIKIKERIYPVGRLDKDSTGLVLLTNDGDLHNKLSHPSFNHEKEYIVKTQHPIQNEALSKMAKGMMIDGLKTRKAKVQRISKHDFKIILKQGLNRQIRKMVVKTGNKVESLKRIRMANIKLGKLKEGTWRYLNQNEIDKLTRSTH